MVTESLILVDKDDNPLGAMEKLEIHRKGLLHRAFSVFIFRSSGELLLQRRSEGKYHSAGFWSNTCDGHPLYQESTEAAASRRLKEEMGIECHLEKVCVFVYRVELGNGLVEHEVDHVFVGYSDVNPVPDLSELSAFKWMKVDLLYEEMRKNPDGFTYWFAPALKRLIARHPNLLR